MNAPANSLLRETTMSLAEAAKRLPPFRPGRPVSVGSLTRWVLHGVHTPAGLVRLEASRVGGHWITSLEALERFLTAQTAALTSPAPLPRTATKRQQESERAAA